MTQKPTTKQIGNHYENLACEWLQNQGLTIIARNYNANPLGEIDIVALEHKILPTGRVYQTLIFVEVKARTVGQFGDGLTSITKAKQQRIINTASDFLQKNIQYKDCDCRFDVVAFDIETVGWISHQWIQGAFLAEI